MPLGVTRPTQPITKLYITFFYEFCTLVELLSDTGHFLNVHFFEGNLRPFWENLHQKPKALQTPVNPRAIARADAAGYIVRLIPIYPPSTVVEDKDSHPHTPTHSPLMKLSR